eukprot:3592125-Prymnesium_polylepis.1
MHPGTSSVADQRTRAAWLGGTLHLDLQLAADVAVAKTDAPAAVQRADRCSSQIDSCTVVDRG